MLRHRVTGLLLAGVLFLGHAVAQPPYINQLVTGDRWITHLTKDLLPFWTSQAALGNPVGAFPPIRCDDGTLVSANAADPAGYTTTSSVLYTPPSAGQATADFTAFDRAAEHYFHDLKLPYAWTPECFYAFGWGLPPPAFLGQQPYAGEPPFEKVDRGQLRPEYKKAYQACLKLFWDHLRQKGWDGKFVLYISDEP